MIKDGEGGFNAALPENISNFLPVLFTKYFIYKDYFLLI